MTLISLPEQWTPEEQVRFLAVEAMGWTIGYKPPSRVPYWCQQGAYVKNLRCFNPLTSGDDMLAVMKAMRKKKFAFDIYIKTRSKEAEEYFVRLNDEDDSRKLQNRFAYASTLNRAVCIAAIKALLAMKETK